MARVSDSVETSVVEEMAPADGASAVSLSGVTLAYRDHLVLDRIDLEIRHGETVAVVGASGSGKSSLLRCLGGFLNPTAGTVRIGDEVVATAATSVPPERRRIGFVFQQYALWPHMTVRENVAYPWRTRGLPATERARRADELLAQVGLAGFEDRAPATLSGGQQQRVALARGLAGEPRVLLLDEPLSSVDAARRDELQTLIVDIAHERKLTTLVTTHDQREAMTFADRIVVLDAGSIAQFASPVELHERPANGYVARFMGAQNVFDVTVVEYVDGVLTGKVDGERGEIRARVTDRPDRTDGVLVARPDAIRVVAVGAGDQDGVVERTVLVDGRSEVRITVGDLVVRAVEAGLPRRSVGERVGLILEGIVLQSEDIARR